MQKKEKKNYNTKFKAKIMKIYKKMKLVGLQVSPRLIVINQRILNIVVYYILEQKFTTIQ